jgi:hypothetical protein
MDMDSLLQIKHHPGEDTLKGKFILDPKEKQFHTRKDEISVSPLQWTPPPLAGVR